MRSRLTLNVLKKVPFPFIIHHMSALRITAEFESKTRLGLHIILDGSGPNDVVLLVEELSSAKQFLTRPFSIQIIIIHCTWHMLIKWQREGSEESAKWLLHNSVVHTQSRGGTDHLKLHKGASVRTQASRS